MDVNQPLPLLGALSPQQFMRRHWQKKPLLIRRAVPDMRPLLSRDQLFALAGQDGQESRLVQQQQGGKKGGWQMRRGPFARRALPALKTPGWTLLLQGMDLQHEAVHQLLQQFAFVPQARLDDVMISYASDGGGVGPHFDSYDVFLLQAHGRRRWRIGRQSDLSLRPDVPLKILANFTPQQEFLLEPGDMLYLPPRWAHDGIAEGECMTYSVGFRAPSQGELARELLQRLTDGDEEGAAGALFRDPGQAATGAPGAIPLDLQAFAALALEKALKAPRALQRALGEYLTEPKPNVWFEAGVTPVRVSSGLRLDMRTRMMYDAQHVFINGESYRAGGRDARLMHHLADARQLGPRALAGASDDALALLQSWVEAGWVHAG
jgi:50S ribosomal protein L16 3-hydroxylase